jgi:hypothetical protein
MSLTSAEEWLVTPPPWRFDIRIEEDLIEEVARLFGFDNIPELPAQTAQTLAPWSEHRVRNERAADLLVDRGYQEAITYTFTDANWQRILHSEPALALTNPISAELGVMRLSRGRPAKGAAISTFKRSGCSNRRFAAAGEEPTQALLALRSRSSGALRRGESISSMSKRMSRRCSR